MIFNHIYFVLGESVLGKPNPTYNPTRLPDPPILPSLISSLFCCSKQVFFCLIIFSGDIGRYCAKQRVDDWKCRQRRHCIARGSEDQGFQNKQSWAVGKILQRTRKILLEAMKLNNLLVFVTQMKFYLLILSQNNTIHFA